MATLLKDLRYSARALRRQPGSTIISVLILALGIGLSTFMFSIVYGVFFRGLDVPASDRLAVVESIDTREPPGQNQRPISSHEFLDYRERLQSFEALAGYYGGTINLADDARPERLQGLWVTANAFDVLRAYPVVGRAFAEGEDAAGLPPSVIIGHHVWRDRYGSDPGVIGSTVRVNGRQGTIVGVMPEGFQWPSDHDVWVTMDDDPRGTARGEGRNYQVIARLADGVSWDQAGLELARVSAQLQQDFPETNEARTTRIVTIPQSQNGPEITMIFTAMMVAVLLVLLVACANVANLLLARAASRTREAGVRVALGAGRFRVMAPFLAEAFVLAAAGAVVGTGLAYWAVDLFDQATAPAITGRPYFMVFQVDLPVLVWVVAITAVTAVAAGVAPALQVSKADVNRVLKDEARGSSSLHLGRLSRGLVIMEVALSVALLVGAGLMTKSIVQLRNHELPFDETLYLAARGGLFETDYPTRDDRQRFWADALRNIRERPEIEAVALSSGLPGTGTETAPIRLEGQSYDAPEDRPLTHFEIVSPGYFALLETTLLEGRDFSAQDVLAAQRVAIVNRSFAERFWTVGSAIGRQFRTGIADTIPWMTVVGVVPDLNMQGFEPAGAPSSIPDGFYIPFTQSDPAFMSVVARPAGGEPLALGAVLRDVVQGLDPNLPLYDMKTLEQEIWESSWFYQVFGTIFIVFGAAALFMASVGLYGVLAFSVSRRTQEIGIRMALGAGGPDVIRMVLRQAGFQIGVGLAIGLLLAALVSRVVGILMFQVNPRDPIVFRAVVALVLGVGLVAGLVPARRASRVDPMVALRAD